MIRRCMAAGLLVAVLGLGCLVARAWGVEKVRMPSEPRERAVTRQAIRSTPLLERPNRPGHFYGNTVRRAVERRAERG